MAVPRPKAEGWSEGHWTPRGQRRVTKYFRLPAGRGHGAKNSTDFSRRRITAAQRKRWAVLKKSQSEGKGVAGPKKRKLSAAGRRAIIAATKKRWAAVRKATAKKARPVAKAATATA